MFEQVSGIASRDHRLRLGVEEHAVAGDREDAGQLMGHDHHRRAEAIAQLEDEVVQQLGADGVQARRRLVEEEDVGVERHGPGQAGALAHAAADLRGIELLEASQPTSASFSETSSAISAAVSRVYSPSGRPTFSASVSELQSAPLWYSTPKRRMIPSRASGSAVQKLSPS